MNEEQKRREMQVEEMAKDYYGYSIDSEADCKFVAEEMYNKGHRKLPEDSVVLSREEYEKLRSLYYCEQGSYMTSNIGDLPLTVEGLRKAVDEITRLNKVETELQELKSKIEELKLKCAALQMRNEVGQGISEAANNLIKNMVKVEKKKAVQEFAEKLRKKVISLNVWEFGEIDIIDADDIDEVLKEYEE